MKIASVRVDEQDALAIEGPNGQIVSVPEAQRILDGAIAPWAYDMVELIGAGPAAIEALARIHAALCANAAAVPAIDPARVQWHPPVRKPSKICCLALNNSANADRIMSGPSHPAVFVKAANALIGHGEAIVVKKHYGRVHPEPELAVIIGKMAKDITPAEALDHVFGYTVHNDITSPTMRREDTFHYRAIHPKNDGTNAIEYVDSYVSYSGRYKGSDTFSPMGPWIALRQDVPDPHALDIQCAHKGELVTEDNTQNLTHKVPEVIAFISSYMTLLPGDIVSMGTALKRVGGTGKAVQNVDLHVLGGPVSVSIEGIGTLSSPVTSLG
ncbi:fumarylacetoacetate hydrolase family protein [Bosea sp. (in: a-proteobacteria)]|uniref:fumarylacetoacetate hydrolase family protein n=1 Tax=Bosea sp. (in: a-proteobacteria) TaxID=1871050 RepID=UPI002638EDB4|nr:fumarylacetoacetate hydrolase family protein [Bosea sp. (in: a-proteobacteria)]MCO5091666.1 fumarylacetoacetate hydrolase family protein [Bosea sp. (in: a-proteobacteria)]